MPTLRLVASRPFQAFFDRFVSATPLPISVWAEDTPVLDPGCLELDKPEDKEVLFVCSFCALLSMLLFYAVGPCLHAKRIAEVPTPSFRRSDRLRRGNADFSMKETAVAGV